MSKESLFLKLLKSLDYERSFIGDTFTFLSKVNKYKLSQKLKEISKDYKPEEVYSFLQDYCERICMKGEINPLLTCAYQCEIWKMKNEILKVFRRT